MDKQKPVEFDIEVFKKDDKGNDLINEPMESVKRDGYFQFWGIDFIPKEDGYGGWFYPQFTVGIIISQGTTYKVTPENIRFK